MQVSALDEQETKVLVDNMVAQALVPLKDLVAAKSRLSGLLSPPERRALAQAMVEDVLGVLASHPLLKSVTLVSDDPAAGMLASKYGIDHLLESSLGCRGLNPVITRACELLDQTLPTIVLHGDLPCLSAQDITAVLDCLAGKNSLVIASDRHGTGTNLLAFLPGSKPQFSFGTDSCARHCSSADSLGLSSMILRRPGIALDVDEAADVALLMTEIERGRQGYCATLLGDPILGNRIRAQLASLVANSDNDVAEAQ